MMLDVLPPGFELLDQGNGKLVLQLPCKCRFPASEAVEPESLLGLTVLDPYEAERGLRERIVMFAAKHRCKK